MTPELALDFKVITKPGAERIIRMAFEHARKTGRKKVTVVTKANVVKTTDGLFLETAKRVGAEFPEISSGTDGTSTFSRPSSSTRRGGGSSRSSSSPTSTVTS